MFNKNNRWILNSVMAIAALAFLGLLVMPIVGAFQSVNRSGATASTATAATPSAEQAELEAQAKGYELVLQREPENQTALRGLLEVRIRQGNVKGAIEPLEKLAALNPDQTDYVVLLAQARQQIGDAEGAARAYRDILSTRPGDINALQGFVDLMLKQERPEAAIGLLQDTLRSADSANKVQAGSVDVAAVQLLLGRVYAEQGRSDEAIAIYDEVIKSNDQDFRPILGKAIVLKMMGNTEDAEPLFETAASLAPPQYKDKINQMASDDPAALSSGDPAVTAPDAEATTEPTGESSSPSRVTGNP